MCPLFLIFLLVTFIPLFILAKQLELERANGNKGLKPKGKRKNSHPSLAHQLAIERATAGKAAGRVPDAPAVTTVHPCLKWARIAVFTTIFGTLFVFLFGVVTGNATACSASFRVMMLPLTILGKLFGG